jgi:acyl-CoA thioesterase YciA
VKLLEILFDADFRAHSMTNLPSERFLAVKAVMMPRDTNPFGTIFGGVLLSYIDQAGVVGAHDLIRERGWPAPTLVTVAMNAVEFHQPVFVGDVVSFWTRVVRIGRTSIAVHVTVETDRTGQTIRLTEAEVVYVAVDEQRQPLGIATGG